jgi:hypothetical protein
MQRKDFPTGAAFNALHPATGIEINGEFSTRKRSFSVENGILQLSARAAPQDLLLAAAFEQSTREITIATLDLKAVVMKQCLELPREEMPMREVRPARAPSRALRWLVEDRHESDL